MSNFDTLKAIVCCAAICLGTLIWLLLSGQKLVPRTLRSAAAVVTRIILVHLLVVPLLCIGGGISIDYLGVPLLVVLIFTPLVTLDSMQSIASDVLSLTVVTVILAPLYAIKQFVLGFPDRSQFILEPDLRNFGPRSEPLSQFIGLSAAVVSPLKPFGYIELNGQQLSAKSEDGSLIEAGRVVLVCDQRNQTLVVRPTAQPLVGQGKPDIHPL